MSSSGVQLKCSEDLGLIGLIDNLDQGLVRPTSHLTTSLAESNDVVGDGAYPPDRGHPHLVAVGRAATGVQAKFSSLPDRWNLSLSQFELPTHCLTFNVSLVTLPIGQGVFKFKWRNSFLYG